MITGKMWGCTEPALVAPLMEMHRLFINPMHQCSLHKHRRKWNAFLVIEGTLFIDVVKDDYIVKPGEPPPVDTTTLGPHGVTTVRPGEYHRFRTGSEPCVAYEFYYTDALAEDIERKGSGGPVTTEAG